MKKTTLVAPVISYFVLNGGRFKCLNKRNFHQPRSHLCMKGVKINEAWEGSQVKWSLFDGQKRVKISLPITCWDGEGELEHCLSIRTLVIQIVLDCISGCTWLAIKKWKPRRTLSFADLFLTVLKAEQAKLSKLAASLNPLSSRTLSCFFKSWELATRKTERGWPISWVSAWLSTRGYFGRKAVLSLATLSQWCLRSEVTRSSQHQKKAPANEPNVVLQQCRDEKL